MANAIFSRALRPSLAAQSSSEGQVSSFICHACRRSKATYARQRKALRIKPDPSFAPSITAKADHIIFNPPSSAPSVYHTPAKFLPPSDPRRKLHGLAQTSPGNSGLLNPSLLASSYSTPESPSSALQSASSSSSATLTKRTRALPTVREQYDKSYHLTPAEIEEIRRLREEDPRKWSRMALADKFNCSQFFVSLCCCSPEMKEERDRMIENVKKRWGQKKIEAREDRATRKALWGRDS